MTATHDQFQQFIVNVAVARKLLLEANNKNALIEGVVLYASIIDALLRQLTLIKRSLKAKGGVSLPNGFVWQGESDNKFSERSIMNLAFEEGVINQNQLNKLNTLYDQRNRLVHRFILSEYKYFDAAHLCDEYELLYDLLIKQLESYERPDPHPLTAEAVTDVSDRMKRKF